MPEPPRAPLRWDGDQGDLLARLREAGDPVADDIVAARDLDDESVQRLVRTITGDADWIDELFERRRPTWPDWVDPRLLAAGQRLYDRQVWSLNVAFFVASLPLSYCACDGAEVLARTGTLADRAQHRVFETALLVREITEQDALGDGRGGRPVGFGYRTVLRLRLLHSAVRRSILVHGHDARTPPGAAWDPGRQGRPVSQLDLLGTMFSFALASVEALESAGRRFEDDEIEGWLHLWCLIGHLLGIEPTLLPMRREEAEACFAAVRAEQFRASEHGAELAEALVAVGEARIPFRANDHLVAVLIRRNIGDECADMIGIPPLPRRHRLRWAQWVWQLAEPDRPPRGLGRLTAAPRRRVRAYLLWRLARHLLDKPADRELRSPEARGRLLRAYGVSDLVGVPDRHRDVSSWYRGLDPPADRSG